MNIYVHIWYGWIAAHECKIQSHLIHSIHMIRSHCIHNCFTAAADNNLNPLLSINNYCNSSKTKHTHTLTANQLLPLSPPSLCLHQLEAAAVRPISHRQQAAIGHKRPDGYDVASQSQSASQGGVAQSSWAFYLHKNVARQRDKTERNSLQNVPKMLHIKKNKPKKQRSMENWMEMNGSRGYCHVHGRRWEGGVHEEGWAVS